MIDFSALGNTLLVFIPAMISPGPDFLLVSSIAVARGRTAGIKAGAGIATACAIHTLLCLVGLAAIFAANPTLALATELVGGFYLANLGRKAWLSTLAKKSEEDDSQPTEQDHGVNAYFAGVTNGLTNPKALAFFTSIFAGALPQNSTAETLITIELFLPSLAVLWFAFASTVLTAPRLKERFMQHQVTMDRIVGTVLGGYGIKMIASVAWDIANTFA